MQTFKEYLQEKQMKSFKKHISEASRRKMFKVDYMYAQKAGSVTSRTQISASNAQLPNLATSETAVLAWLRKRHNPGAEITIISLDWFDS